MLGIIKAFTHAVKGISVLLKQMKDTLLSGNISLLLRHCEAYCSQNKFPWD